MENEVEEKTIESNEESRINSTNTLIKKKELSASSRFNLTLLVIFFVFFSASFFISSSLKKEKIVIANSVDNSQIALIPQNLEVLKNQAFTEWTARVKGRVNTVSDGSIVILPIQEKFLANGKREVAYIGGASTEIFVVPGMTFLFESVPASDGANLISLDLRSVKKDKILDGSVGISYQNNSYKLFGRTITIRD